MLELRRVLLNTGVIANGTTIGATRTPAGSVPPCLFFDSQNFVNLEANADVWYRWTAQCTAPAAVVTFTDGVWLQVAVYRGCYDLANIGGAPVQLVACGALENGQDNPYARFTPEAGVNYSIRVMTYNVPVDFRVVVGQSAPNDTCAGAFPPSVNVSSVPANVVADTRCAVPSSGGLAPPACGDAGAGQFDMGGDVYHKLNIQTTGTLRMTRCSGSYWPVVALYPSCPDGGSVVDPLTCGYAASGSCSPVLITYPVIAGQQLVMRTGGIRSDATGGIGFGTLTLTITPAATGACCQISGACAPTAGADCAGIYSGDGTVCAPNPCPQPTGACCNGTVCVVRTAAACAAAGGTYTGNGRPCLGQPGNHVTCCTANFNGAGGVTVQDLFDFLGAYFTGDLRADVNSSGTVTVQDIFDSLARYFVGC